MLKIVTNPDAVASSRHVFETAVRETEELAEELRESASSNIFLSHITDVAVSLLYPEGNLVLHCEPREIAKNVRHIASEDNITFLKALLGKIVNIFAPGGTLRVSTGTVSRSYYIVVDLAGDIAESLYSNVGDKAILLVPYPLASLLPHPFTDVPTAVTWSKNKVEAVALAFVFVEVIESIAETRRECALFRDSLIEGNYVGNLDEAFINFVGDAVRAVPNQLAGTEYASLAVLSPDCLEEATKLLDLANKEANCALLEDRLYTLCTIIKMIVEG